MQGRQDTSGVHVWLVLGKAFRALAAHAGESLKPEADRPRRLGFPCARSAAPQGTVAGQYDWTQSMAYAPDRSVSRSIGWRRQRFVKRKNTDDRRVRLVEPHGERARALHHQDLFGNTRPAMEEAAGVLSNEERRMLLRLLKKTGKRAGTMKVDSLDRSRPRRFCVREQSQRG